MDRYIINIDRCYYNLSKSRLSLVVVICLKIEIARYIITRYISSNLLQNRN
jgi:hypothetical protein